MQNLGESKALDAIFTSFSVAAKILEEKEKIELFESLLTDYNSNIRAQVGEKLNVTVNFYIETLSDIDQSKMEYEMTVFFRP